jgi:hypothetical protein
MTLLGPLAASYIPPAAHCFDCGHAFPFDFCDFLVALLLFAIPVGYAFGVVPVLLAASLYCAAMTAHSRPRERRLLTRACVGAVCGGVASWVWFGEWLRVNLHVYALVGALVVAGLSLGSPRPSRLLENSN